MPSVVACRPASTSHRVRTWTVDGERGAGTTAARRSGRARQTDDARGVPARPVTGDSPDHRQLALLVLALLAVAVSARRDSSRVHRQPSTTT